MDRSRDNMNKTRLWKRWVYVGDIVASWQWVVKRCGVNCMAWLHIDLVKLGWCGWVEACVAGWRLVSLGGGWCGCLEAGVAGRRLACGSDWVEVLSPHCIWGHLQGEKTYHWDMIPYSFWQVVRDDLLYTRSHRHCLTNQTFHLPPRPQLVLA